MQIASMFSNSSALYLLHKTGVKPLRASAENGSGICMVASELSLFSLLDLSDVPQGLRAEFIKQRALQLSPFKQTAHYSHVLNDHAQLWVWDKTIESQLEEDLNLSLVPEQLLLAKVQDGLCIRVQQGEERSQLEFWREGVLHAVKAYSRKVTEKEKAEFSAKNSPKADSVHWQEADYSYLDIPRDEPEPLSLLWLVQPKVLNILTLCLCLIVLSGFLGHWLRWEYLVSTKTAKLDQQSDSVQELLIQREEVFALEQKNQLISSYFQYAPVIELAAEFEDRVGAFYDELLEWNYDQGSLSVLLLDRSGNSRRYIESLSSSGLFDQVSASPDVRPDAVRISLDVQPGVSRQDDSLSEVSDNVISEKI